MAACSAPVPLVPALNHERSLTPLSAHAPEMERGGERVEKGGIERDTGRDGERERKEMWRMRQAGR